MVEDEYSRVLRVVDDVVAGDVTEAAEAWCEWKRASQDRPQEEHPDLDWVLDVWYSERVIPNALVYARLLVGVANAAKRDYLPAFALGPVREFVEDWDDESEALRYLESVALTNRRFGQILEAARLGRWTDTPD